MAEYIPKYVFTRIPNDEEGQELVRLMKKYLNKSRYKIRVRGQGLVKGEDWRKYTYGQPLDKSTHLRIYIETKRPTTTVGREAYIEVWRSLNRVVEQANNARKHLTSQ